MFGSYSYLGTKRLSFAKMFFGHCKLNNLAERFCCKLKTTMGLHVKCNMEQRRFRQNAVQNRAEDNVSFLEHRARSNRMDELHVVRSGLVSGLVRGQAHRWLAGWVTCYCMYL